jgi:hypothetical protein
MARTGIAKLWKPVINVTDLDAGESFWSAVSGLSPQGRHGQFSVLDADQARCRPSRCGPDSEANPRSSLDIGRRWPYGRRQSERGDVVADAQSAEPVQ